MRSDFEESRLLPSSASAAASSSSLASNFIGGGSGGGGGGGGGASASSGGALRCRCCCSASGALLDDMSVRGRPGRGSLLFVFRPLFFVFLAGFGTQKRRPRPKRPRRRPARGGRRGPHAVLANALTRQKSPTNDRPRESLPTKSVRSLGRAAQKTGRGERPRQ